MEKEKDVAVTGLESKQIEIQGQSNRYLMKKLIAPKSEQKKQKKSTLHNTDEVKPFYLLENQPFCLSILLDKEEKLEDRVKENENEKALDSSSYSAKALILQSIQKKRSAYKQQDKKADKITGVLITMDEVILKLTESNLHCYYCQDALYLLYQFEREPKQWTLDRIDNNLGHTNQNVVICCLQCNLKRRTRSHNAFLFTKQTKIMKQE